MAQRVRLLVFKKLNLGRIGLGAGKRLIIKNGKYDTKHQITYPREIQLNE